MGVVEAFGVTFVPTLLDLVALTSLKASLLRNSALLYGIGVLSGAAAYAIVGGLTIFQGQAVANTNWNILSTISSTLVGALLWGENLTKTQALGIGLSCISFYLING
jgi:drug/metabolite transporter (DMT)-like permease